MTISGKTGKKREKIAKTTPAAEPSEVTVIEADTLATDITMSNDNEGTVLEVVNNQDVSESTTEVFRGFLENATNQQLTGWCCNLQNPINRPVLEFICDSGVLGVTLCNMMRDDLKNLGIGDGMHGFCWVPKEPLTARQLASLQIRVMGHDFFLEINQHLAMPALDESKPANLQLDAVTAHGVAGWIKDDGTHDEIALQLYVDDQPIGSYLANIFRPDVKESGQDSGRFGYLVPLPDICYENPACSIRLEIPALGEVIEVSDEFKKQGLFEGARFEVAHGLLSGVVEHAQLPKECKKLEVFADEKLLAHIAINTQNGPQTQFSYELPLQLADGEAHRIHIGLAGSPWRLPTTTGQASLEFVRTIKGKIDFMDSNVVEGWVFDIEAPDESIEVELYDGDVFLGKSSTDRTRADVNKLFGLTGNHGFLFHLQAFMHDGLEHRLRVVYKGQSVTRKQSLPWPLVLKPADLAATPPANRFEGRVENVSIERITGWVYDHKNPSRPVQVAIYVDDQFVGSTLANRFAARLRTGVRSGHHVFLFRMPSSQLMNGGKRNIKVVVVEANYELPNPTNTMIFPLANVLGDVVDSNAHPNFSYTPPASLYQGKLDQHPPLQAESGGVMVSIIILNWNGVSILRECLASFLRIEWALSYEILLVDHGSTDGSLEMANEFIDKLPLRVLPRGANYSFAASNNFAAKQARGKLLAFANNDLVMLHDCLASMAKYLRDPEVGVVGLKLQEPIRMGVNEWDYITHHQGVKFGISDPLPGGRRRYYVPMEIGEQYGASLAAVYDMPVVTGALLLCRSTDFKQLGGFHEQYFYGMEDVDLCLGFHQKLGKKIVCDTSAVALHNRSATRESKLRVSDKEKLYNAQIHTKNRKLYIERFGRGLTRTILRSLVAGDQFWREKPLRVVFMVTETALTTPAGDLFTAMELGEAMRRLFGWDVLFVKMDTHALPGTDVLIVMRHDYHIQKVVDANPGLVTVAWARNRVDQWVNAPYFDAYQVIFCSSQKAIDYVFEKTGRTSTLLPIATNAQRFSPHKPAAAHISDVTFTGNYWGATREAIGLQDLVEAQYKFAMYGHGWDKCPEWSANWRGAVEYNALPEIYSSAKIVLDDSHPVTRVWNSLNSRVFDALGCGRLVLTNCAGGAQELFPDLLPHFDNDQELQALIKHYLNHPEEREDLAARLHAEVLANHTYDNRAQTFRTALAAALEKRLHFAIKIGVPKMEEREAWGDYHFALGIKRALEKQGHFARIDILPNWDQGVCAGDDVVIVLRGLSQFQPQPTALNLMWLISHPDDVKLSEFQQYDHVFVASTSFASQLSNRLGDKVSPLLQCTDPTLFFKEEVADLGIADLLFVGNSRGQRREGVQYALESNLDFCVYGELWEGMLPASKVRGKHIPNQILRQYYSSAKMVLNDHWPDMRSEGFISNRIFDAGACGATLITDDMQACRELFGDDLAYYASAEELAQQVEQLTQNDAARKKRGDKLRKLIHEKHTFDNRVADILAVVEKLAAKQSQI